MKNKQRNGYTPLKATPWTTKLRLVKHGIGRTATQIVFPRLTGKLSCRLGGYWLLVANNRHLLQRCSTQKEALLQETVSPARSDLCERTREELVVLTRPVTPEPPITELRQSSRCSSPVSTITQLQQQLLQFPSPDFSDMSSEVALFSAEGNPMEYLCPAGFHDLFQKPYREVIMLDSYNILVENFSADRRKEIKDDKIWQTPISTAKFPQQTLWFTNDEAEDDSTNEIAKMVVFVPLPQEGIQGHGHHQPYLASVYCKGIQPTMMKVSKELLKARSCKTKAGKESLPDQVTLPISAASLNTDQGGVPIKATLWIKFDRPSAVDEHHREMLLSPGNFPAEFAMIGKQQFSWDGFTFSPSCLISPDVLGCDYGGHYSWETRTEKEGVSDSIYFCFNSYVHKTFSGDRRELQQKAEVAIMSSHVRNLVLFLLQSDDPPRKKEILTFHFAVKVRKGENSILVCGHTTAEFKPKEEDGTPDQAKKEVAGSDLALSNKSPVWLQAFPNDMRMLAYMQKRHDQKNAPSEGDPKLECVLPLAQTQTLLEEFDCDLCRQRDQHFVRQVTYASKPNEGAPALEAKVLLKRVSKKTLELARNKAKGGKATDRTRTSLPWDSERQTAILKLLLDGKNPNELEQKLGSIGCPDSSHFKAKEKEIMDFLDAVPMVWQKPGFEDVVQVKPLVAILNFGDGIVGEVELRHGGPKRTFTLPKELSDHDVWITRPSNEELAAFSAEARSVRNGTKRKANGLATPNGNQKLGLELVRSDRQATFVKISDLGLLDSLKKRVGPDRIKVKTKRDWARKQVDALDGIFDYETLASTYLQKKPPKKSPFQKPEKKDDKPKDDLKNLAAELLGYFQKGGGNDDRTFKYSKGESIKFPDLRNTTKTKEIPTTLILEETLVRAKENFCAVRRTMIENQVAAKIRLARDNPTKILQTTMDRLLTQEYLTNEKGALFVMSVLNLLITTQDVDTMFPEEGICKRVVGNGTKIRDTLLALMLYYAGLPFTGGTKVPMVLLFDNPTPASNRQCALLLEILPLIHAIMAGFIVADRFDHYEAILMCLGNDGKHATKNALEKLASHGTYDYENWGGLFGIGPADSQTNSGCKSKVSDVAVPFNIYLLLQILGVVYCPPGGKDNKKTQGRKKPRTEDAKPSTPKDRKKTAKAQDQKETRKTREEPPSRYDKVLNFPLHEDNFFSLLTHPSLVWSNSHITKGSVEYTSPDRLDKGVGCVQDVTYRAAVLDDDGLPVNPDSEGRPQFVTKTINCNMWRGAFADQKKLQPQYDLARKGDEATLKERGYSYEPQYYQLPVGRGKKKNGHWKARPAVHRVVDDLYQEYWDPKWKRFVKLTHVKFQQYDQNDVPLPPDMPIPSRLLLPETSTTD